MTGQASDFSKGAVWLRWEPHIHTPGTVLNDQYGGGEDAWEQYLLALESASPTLRAIGATDYYAISTYERVVEEKTRNGRLPACDLLFPNIEMRLALGTHRGNWVNIHLLVSPDDPKHIEEVSRLLGRLRFRAYDDEFGCTRSELIRLGQRVDPTERDEAAALRIGTEQYKVSKDDLVEVFRGTEWPRKNVLIAVAAGADGTSGVRDGSDATLREEVEKHADIIFSGNPADRDFWLGQKPSMSVEAIRARFGSLKPVIWGSDAHMLAKVGKPDQDRYCWIKGAPTFDALKQVCIEPRRSYVGELPPSGATPSQTIAELAISGAPWLLTPSIALNPGLVAIIGARGSGKTALADMIAAGCDAFTEEKNAQSFINRANADGFLDGASVEVRWAEGTPISKDLANATSVDWDSYARVRYLSQQFVDELCSSTGMTDRLLSEIERVVFDAHSSTHGTEASDFGELLNLNAGRFRDIREREEDALADVSDRIGNEIEKASAVDGLRRQIAEKEQAIKGYTADRAKLIPKGSDQDSKMLADVMEATETVRGYLRAFAARDAALASVKDDVLDLRTNRAPTALRGMKERYRPSGFSDDEWANFLLNHQGRVDDLVSGKQKDLASAVASWRGEAPAAPVNGLSFVPAGVELAKLPLATLEAETARLQKLIAADNDTAQRLAAVSKRISGENVQLAALNERLKDCEGAPARRQELLREREAGYRRVFDALLEEERVLRELYAPLMERLTDGPGSVRKLTFSVSRTADTKAWAQRGEEFIDARKNPLKGIGTLKEEVDKILKEAWETGDAAEAAAAMSNFRTTHLDGIIKALKISPQDQAYRATMKRLAQWLYSTEHISLHYSIDYDGIDIRRLSPGTRGIVLLLLYLALDDADDRPLIIDQPEENLDPKSIYDELVALFQAAKLRRQVIMVTHNANLVVNADADQIIIASVGPHQPGALPPITYVSGGLDEAPIRQQVCEILEGGEEAFKERARRLRVTLPR